MAENYGFLEEEHPLCRYIQEGFSKGREKGKSGMRVRVASTDELLQEALPDGTLVVSQGLLNVIPYKELLSGLAAHELARFELNSSQEEV